MKNHIYFYLSLILASGCSVYTVAAPGEHDFSGLKVQTGLAWNQLPRGVRMNQRVESNIWTRDGTSLDRIVIIPGVPSGEPIFPQSRSSQALPVFESSMLPNEIEELAESSIAKLYRVGVAVETSNLRPHRYGDNRGILFDLAVTLSDGPNYRGVAGALIVNEKLHIIFFLGAEPYYYQKHLEDALVIIKGARVTAASDILAGSSNLNELPVNEQPAENQKKLETENQKKLTEENQQRLEAEYIGSDDELLFLGMAAAEITSKSYDQAIWEKALALADGDEQKRNGIYIKLRSEQLALEKKNTDAIATRLNGEQAKAHLTGRTEVWTKGGAYYGADGTMSALWKGRRRKGDWEVSADGNVCYYLTNWPKLCQYYVNDAGAITMIYEGKSTGVKIMLEGNRLSQL